MSALCVRNPVCPLVLGEIKGVRKPGEPDPTWTLESKLGKIEVSNDNTGMLQNRPKSEEMKIKVSESIVRPKVDDVVKQKPENCQQDGTPEDKVAMEETRSQAKNKLKPFKPLVPPPKAKVTVTADLLTQL